MAWIQNLLVGVLFFGALTAVGYFTIVSESGPFAEKGQLTVLYFDNADGVKTGSRVTVLGVPSGVVKDISLVAVDESNNPVPENAKEAKAHRVALTIELKKPVVFYDNYKISIKNESILSGKIIAIDPGSALAAGGRRPQKLDVFSIPAIDAVNRGKSALDLMFETKTRSSFTDLQGEVTGDPLAGLSEMINENREDLRKTLSNVAEITGKINNGKGTLGLLINNDELHRSANTLVTDAQIVLRELRESLEDTREQAPVSSFIRAALTAF